MNTRREFIRITLGSGAALTLGAGFSFAADPAVAWRPNAWIRIEPAGDVVVVIGKQEMGQGVRTSLAMIVAEELDLDWEKIRIEQASTAPEYTSLNTGGSGSVRGSWRVLRPAAATAHEMLLRAAAKEWNASRDSLRTDHGFVTHPDGRKRSYGSLAATAATLEIPKDVPLKPAKDFRIVGRPLRRIDGPAIVTGAAKYGLDTRVPGMRFAAIVRCPVVGGMLKSFDAAEAKKVHGVLDVLAVPSGVAVVASNTWAALKGQRLVRAVWDDGPNATFDSAKYIESLLANADPGVVMTRTGDFDAASSAAARTVEARYVYPFLVHAPMEPMNAIARVSNGSCEIWAPTQAPNRVQSFVAKHLGTAPDRVTVHPTLIGGGFGRRLAADYAIDAADVSKAIGGAPVQVVWSREDDMRHGHLQHATVESLKGALDSDGRIVAWSHTKITNPLMTVIDPPTADEMKDLGAFYMNWSWGVYDVPYAAPNIRTSYVRADSPVRYGPWRSVESPSGVLGRECFFDEMARAAGRDPLQMRLDHLGAPDKATAGDLTIDRSRLRRVLEIVRTRSNWGKKLGAGRGQGVACNAYGAGTFVAYVVEVSASKSDWHVDRVVAAVDCGLRVNPAGVRQQMEGGIVWALTQLMTEATLRGGAVEQTSFTDYAVPRLSDIPRIEVHIVDSDDPEPHGMGEPPVPPFAPAVLNALFDATGTRIRRLPVRLA